MTVKRPSDSDYRLGRGDVIEVKVFGEDQFNQVARLSGSGEITMPFIGNVQLGGLSQFEAEARLRELLGASLLKNPQVVVFIREYRSQPVFILGAVNSPGQYLMTHQLRLVDALSMAGGLSPNRAGENVIVQRNGGTDSTSKTETIRVDLKELLEEGNLALNIPLQGGDIVQVPERLRQVFYVIGEVHRPGLFELPAKQPLFLTQALAQAGGPMRTAKIKKGMLIRFDEKGGRKEIAVNLDNILKGRTSDMSLSPNDVIFVPGSTFKNIGYGLLGVIPGTVSSTVTYGVR
ncbi:MAG: polysaccharide biosynthesis/export family protein [Acidobacteriota bacterium]